MKFLSVRDLRTHSARVWRDLADEKEMVVTSNGQPVAVLSSVDEESLESVLTAWRQARAAQAISDLQRESVRKGLDRTTPAQVDAEIAAARKERRKRSR